MRLATRRSLNKVQGETPALRERFPSSDKSVPLKSAGQGSWKTPVGEYLELTAGKPSAVHPGLTKVFGRPVSDESCKLSPSLVMMLKGRPLATSMMGAKVQSLKNFPAKPSPIFPL